jgi:phosphoglycolate phosphatase
VNRLVVFDLDGTLIDSRRDIANSANLTLAGCGAEPLPEEQIGRMVGDGAAVLVARAFEAAGVPAPSDALERFLAIYNGQLLKHTCPYPGIPDVLDRLEKRTTLAVLTNKPLAATRAVLAGLGLARHFSPDRVIGGDGPFRRKPDPGALHYLMTSSHVQPSETVLVGDSVVDWRTAHAAATRVCLVRYGFGWEGFPIEELSSTECVVDSPADIEKCL